MAKKKKNNNALLYWLGGITALLLIGAVMGKQAGWIGQKKLTKVAVEPVKKRNITETVSATGKIYPEVEVSITPDVSGEVVKLKIEEGDSVRQGQLLAVIDPDIYKSIVERSEASVNAAKSNEANAKAQKLQTKARVEQLRVQIKNAKATYDRQKQLYTDEIVSLADLETAETSWRSLQADLAGLEASLQAADETIKGASYNIKSAEASFKEANNNLKRTSIYAPMSGIVSKLNVEQGERVVGTAQMAGTEMMRIANFSAMQAEVEVSENDILRVKLGDTAVIEVDAYLDRDFKGIVTQIANSAANTSLQSATDQITNFIVEIRLLPKTYKDLVNKNRFPFRPGMSCSVDIETKKLANIVTVPIQAVTTREIPDSLRTNETGEEELQEVVFIQVNGKVQPQNVKVGVQDEKYIEILDGLQGEESVVSAPYRTITKKLKADMEVEVVKKEDLYQKTKKDSD
ncbi:MAG: efflux RND transporter periplasmic adaptor subunit [Chitinophagales bacterium]